MSENTGEDSQGRRDGEQSFQEGKGSLGKEEALREGEEKKDGFQEESVWSKEGEEAAQITLAQLQDYDFLMKHFYSVHASTTAGRDLMKADMLLGTGMKLEQNPQVPQILIYHTHSQETYADYGPENPEATIVSCGEYLAELLRDRGWNVIHDTGTYDIQGGKLDSFSKARTVKQAKTTMLSAVAKDLEERFDDPKAEKCWLEVAYTCEKEMAEEFLQEIRQQFPQVQEIHMDPLSLSVACHIGPGALAVAVTKKIDAEAERSHYGK